MRELCVRHGAHLHSRLYFVLRFCKGLRIRDAFPQRDKRVAGHFPHLPGSFSSAPEASWRRLGGRLPSLRQLSSNLLAWALESLRDLGTQPLGSKIRCFDFSGKGHASQATAS